MINLLEKSKHPIIVFEGPDGCGKTTLAKELASIMGARYIHLTYRFKDKMDLYHTAAIRLAAHLAQHQPVIIDRWWPSEIIYADAYRGGSKFTKQYFLLEHIATEIGVTYVFCIPANRNEYLKFYNELKGKREEMYNEGLDRVWQGYSDMWRTYFQIKENVCHYDMFQNLVEDEHSREIILSNICNNILEFTEDHRSYL